VGRLLAGQVNQDDQTFLDDAQIAQGYALLCVSLPLTPCLIRPDVQAELEA
jgi:ferredoxin